MNFVIAFIGGIITFISPCVLPLIPMYIAYITGISVQDLKEKKSKKPFFKIFIHSLFFVIGFALIFTTLAALFYIFIQWLGNYKIWFNRIAGALIIIFGFQIMGLIHLPFLNYEAKIQAEIKKSNLFSSFLMGLAFGAGWTPCIGPILSGILFTSTASKTPFIAVMMLLTYSIGLGIPFILTGLLTNKLISLFEGIKKHYHLIEIISGIFLIFLGLILFFDWTGYLSGWLSGLVPNLSGIESKLAK